jgi:outer membrane receptor protein involved in Fe transport
MDWKDIQQNVIVQFNGVGLAAAINGSSATGWGTDLGATIRLLPGWRLGGTLSWNDLALTEPVYSAGTVLIPQGARPAFSAKLTGGLFTDYRVDIGTDLTLALSASANYRSSTAYYGVGAPVVYSDEPWLGRISIGLEAGERWSARLFVDNVSDFDGHLTPPLTPSSDMRQRPRSYGIQFELHQ